jgi:hypothetical protein
MKYCQKKLFIVLFIIPFTGLAQVVLDSNNIPQPGFEYIYLQAVKPGISIDTSGAGLTWDYSDFDQTADTIKKSYWLPLGFYPSIEDPADESRYDFSTTDSLHLLRVDSNIFVIAYEYDKYMNIGTSSYGYFEKEIPVFQIPFEYLDEVGHEFSFTPHVNESRLLKAEAWGTVILPDTIYGDVLRIHYFDEQFIDYEDPSGGWTEYSTVDSYEYFTEESNVPVLIIEFYFSHLVYDWNDYYSWDTTILVYDHMDTLDCMIECPEDTTIYFQSDTCCVLIEPETPLISHPEDMVTLWNDHTNDSSASGYYPEGTSTVKWYIKAGTNIDSCSFNVNVVNTFGIHEYSGDIQYTSYPNPCKDILNIRYGPFSRHNKPSVLGIDILSIDGRLIRRIEEVISGSHHNEIHLDVSELPAGVYFIRLRTESKTSSGKFLKVHE